MPSLGAIRGCREQAQVLDSDSVGHLVPAITHLFYDDAHLCLFHLSPGPARNRPGRDPCPLPLPLPSLSSFYLSASSFCLSFAFWARQVLPLFDSHPLVVRLVTSSSPACLVPYALCLSSGFIVSTGDYKYRPCARLVFGSLGHINCDFLPLLSLSCTIFAPPVNKSRSEETEGLSKEDEENEEEHKDFAHAHFITSISMGPTYLLLSLLMFL